MPDGETLAGYVAAHGRPPALEGRDGRPYTVAVFSEDDPGPDGRFGAALLFVRWSPSNEPDGHLESGFLAFDADPRRAEEAVARLTLREVRERLDLLIVARDCTHPT